MLDGATKRSVSILMLEDNDLDAELAIARLHKADLHPQVTLVHDRAGFEQALEARPYDLVLADYALPDFDGITALSMARDVLPQTPFIFISGRVGEEVAIDTLQRGATDYVLKHRLERLVPAVVRALKESEEHTTRMQAEARFRQSELRFRRVIDIVPQMIWVSTAQGRLTYTNQVWRDNTLPGTLTWCEPKMFEPEDYPGCMAAWHTALATNKPFTVEVRLLRPSDDTYRWHLIRMTPMEPGAVSSGTVISGDDALDERNWLGSATDLQDQKLNEEALRTAEKLSVTGRMAAAIAHEINNPLESITNLLFLIRLESERNERALSFLDMAESELQRISSITKQTLQFYRDPAMPVEVDTRQLLDEVMRLFTARMNTKNIALTMEFEQGLVFQAIKGEIRQVLINLVSNAIDAVGQSGAITIEAQRTYWNDESVVRIEVRDTGTGITPEQAARLFQPFYSTKGALGTGLGLWVSKGIVEKHGGRLSLYSDKVEGHSQTTATVILPSRARPELQLIPGGKTH